ncbi:dnaJ homolog subfamily C member 17 [Cephus cinctus]|uniref:DnaJ homolog subfamily C member 17 n=1 Tax=Cephus cinctus TaxID=211228 RepID=A0AAJ7BLJ3_CEPCN|nr:dnaJ homolog subfamily C member 17 [Cephus cinctus]
MEDIMHLDLYELIGTVPTASTKEIKRAYRTTALSCHPDKNPDNPRAAELFHQLSKALEILTTESTRVTYDKAFNARHQAKLRLQEYDVKRKRLIEELNAREEAHRQEVKSKAEIEKLRKESRRLFMEEQELARKKDEERLQRLKQEFCKQNNIPQSSVEERRIKIKWKVVKDDQNNGGYDYDTLYDILIPYGAIEALVISKNNKGRAMVEFQHKRCAELAAQKAIGHVKNPLTLKGLWTTNKNSKSSIPQSTEPSRKTFSFVSPAPEVNKPQSSMSFEDYERMVLGELRQAADRQKLQDQENT